MRTSTSREESSLGGVASRAERACRQSPAMEEGTGVSPGCSPGYVSVLNSPSLRSLVGGECLQILRCGICMEFFNIPIVLPCGHTFCLQCLTEMCKHATRPRGPNPVVTEVLIGCPNCRVQIFATPILQRNVTCNFIIQSLVDMLRNRKVPVQKHVSINTERSLIGPPVRAVSEEALCGVLQDLDRLSASLQHRSVVDDAFFEIENIRRLHLASRDQSSGDSPDVKTDCGNPTRDSSDASYLRGAASCATLQPDSSTTTCTGLSQLLHDNPDSPNSKIPRRCYAAAVAAAPGKDRPATTSTAVTTKTNISVNATRGTPQPCSTLDRSQPPPTCTAGMLPLPPAASYTLPSSSSSGFRNRNRNNSEASHDISPQQIWRAVEHAQNGAGDHSINTKNNMKFRYPFRQDCVFMVTEKEQIQVISNRVGQSENMSSAGNRSPSRQNRKQADRVSCSTSPKNHENLSPELSPIELVDIILHTKQVNRLCTLPVSLYEEETVSFTGEFCSYVVANDSLSPRAIIKTRSPL
ncbi:uncharacterized protein [Littorina saxatilis]